MNSPSTLPGKTQLERIIGFLEKQPKKDWSCQISQVGGGILGGQVHQRTTVYESEIKGRKFELIEDIRPSEIVTPAKQKITKTTYVLRGWSPIVGEHFMNYEHRILDGESKDHPLSMFYHDIKTNSKIDKQKDKDERREKWEELKMYQQVVDLESPEGEKTKNQNEWISHFNDKKRIMISMPDIIRITEKAPKMLLDDLRCDTDTSFQPGIVTSTRILYNPDGITGRIVHNYGSNVTKPKVSDTIFLPDYNYWEHLDGVVKTKEGRVFLQTLFDEKNIKKITDALLKFSNQGSHYNAFWLVDKKNRERIPEQAMMIELTGDNYPGEGCMHYRADGYELSGGLTRGVKDPEGKKLDYITIK